VYRPFLAVGALGLMGVVENPVGVCRLLFAAEFHCSCRKNAENFPWSSPKKTSKRYITLARLAAQGTLLERLQSVVLIV